jgi:hypothetical protein
MLGVLAGGSVAAMVAWAAVSFRRRGRAPIDRSGRMFWRMPPLDQLPPPRLTPAEKTWMLVLRGYLVVAAGLVLLRIVQLAMTGHA